VIEAWRITRKRFAAEAFSGEGARLYGGRWNRPGVVMVYTAGSRSLAILEILVHLRRTQPLADYVLIPVTFEASLVTVVESLKLPSIDENRAAAEEVPGLPENWDSEPPPVETQALGDLWIAAGHGPVLAVPSAVVPAERNYLLNPAHPLFGQIRIGTPVPCRIDQRLLKS